MLAAALAFFLSLSLSLGSVSGMQSLGHVLLYHMLLLTAYNKTDSNLFWVNRRFGYF